MCAIRTPQLTPPAVTQQAERSDFGVFWFGQALAQVAGRSSTVVLPLLAVVVLKSTPVQVGLLNAVQSVPVFAMTLVAGVWVDHTSRHRNLIVAHLCRGLCLTALALAASLGFIHLPLLCAVGFVLGALGALADVSSQSYLPTLVPQAELLRANTRIETTTALATVAAPGVGGLLIGVFGGPGALWPFAVGLLGAAASLQLIKVREARSPRPSRAVFRGVTDGLRVITGHGLLRLLVLQAAWFNLFEQAVITLYLVYGIRSLHLAAGLVGLTMTLGALGTFLGSFTVRRLRSRIGVGPSLALGIGAASVAPIMLPLAAGPKPVTVALCSIAFVVYGFGLTVFNVFSVSVRQWIAPPELLGQVTAAFRAVAFGTIWIGAVLGGVVGQYLGVRFGLIAASAALVAGWLVFTVCLRRSGAARQFIDPAGVNS